ncbi:MAG: hypothetical protein R3A47_12010 [Polyangiales bacterium]
MGLPVDCGDGAHEENGIRDVLVERHRRANQRARFPTDPLMALTSVVFSERNDGLVGRCSSHFGEVLRDTYFQNHLDEVGLMFGLISPFTANPKSIFRAHANRLKNEGL